MANIQQSGYLPYMPVYNSVAARGTLKGLTDPSVLAPEEASTLGKDALGGFFDHMLEANKEPTKQEKVNALLIARGNAIGRLKEEETRNNYIRSKAPLSISPLYQKYINEGRDTPPHLRSQRAVTRMPDRYSPNWDQNMGSLVGKHPNRFKEGSPLEVELMYIDAELKRLSGVEGYSNRGQTWQPKRQYVDHPDSIFYQDDLTPKKDADIGGFFNSILKGLGSR